MEGTLDMKNRCFTIYTHLGIAEVYMWFQGVDGVLVLRFTSYECYGFHGGWEHIDYPIDREEYQIEKKLWYKKRS